MTKIVFNYSGLKSTVEPSLDDAIDQLDIAINLCNNMVVPSDFKYLTYMSNLKSNIVFYKKNINTIKSWIDKTDKKLSSSEDDITSDLNQIEKIKISRRNTAVRNG